MSDPAEFPVVVCVDDEPAILSSLQRLLRKESFHLLTTEKPDEAITWILQRKASLVIADQRMPGISGLDLLEMVRACSPSTIRVMLTGQSDLTEVLKRTRIEAIEWMVRKPWDGEELKATLRGLLSRKGRLGEMGRTGL
ncbi:MAG TPA: response regulator [Planctomycetota bacterium]|nr:response regulator [Planctomycetota bacterium]